MRAYYNEIEPFAAAWLRELIADGIIMSGDVDTRSIADVTADDVMGYTRCHFFAGVAGWDLALQLAGWPADRPVWTGSCPCQPFSAAGKRHGTKDARHLWPEFARLIGECRPPTVIGEQVASAIGHGWLDGVFANLEREDYACGAVVLGAHSVGAPHIRQRLYWAASCELGNTDSTRQRSRWGVKREPGCEVSATRGPTDRLADTQHPESRLRDEQEPPSEQRRDRPAIDDDAGGRGDLLSTRLEGRKGQPGDDGPQQQAAQRASCDAWSDSRPILCRDGKWRRIPSPQSVFLGLVDGLSSDVGYGRPEDCFPLAEKVHNRVGMLRGYGNAIVPQVAAEFIRAFLEIE